MMLDLTKPMQTRDGRKVTIYTTNASSKTPIHGFIEGAQTPIAWTITGYTGPWAEGHAPNEPCALVNVPVKHTREFWTNEYTPEQTIGYRYNTRAEADRNVMPDGYSLKYIGCIHHKYEFQEGEGLN